MEEKEHSSDTSIQTVELKKLETPPTPAPHPILATPCCLGWAGFLSTLRHRGSLCKSKPSQTNYFY